jgi:predicted alpha/beta-fold hydrolase
MKNFNPPALLRNTHVQSVLNSLKLRKPIVKRRAKGMLHVSRPRIIHCGNGVRLQGFYSGHNPGSRDLCILIHGWEGSADSSYLISAAGYLWDKRYSVFRLNLRDHGESHHLNKELFHSCRIAEVAGAVKVIAETFPHQRLFLGGFSLGGNFALRVAMRAPDAGIHLDRVVAVCPVLNPKHTIEALESGLFIYHWYFMKKWRSSLEIKRKYFPDMHGLSNIPHFNKISEMTDYFVRRFTEYPDLYTYLNGYTITGEALAHLQVPSTIIASLDDPVIPAKDLPELAKPECLTIETTRYGGHCGFLENFRLTSRADRRMAEIFQIQ